MAQTLVVTDSSACLPASIQRRPGLRLVAIPIELVDGEGVDGDLDPRRVWQALRRGEAVKTRAPAALDYLFAVEEPGFDAAVVITAASTFTGMHEHALQAAALSARPVLVVDSHTAAAAQGLVVRAAHVAAVGGASAAEVAAAAVDAARRADLVATLPGLASLERSGRLPADVLDAARRSGPSHLFRLSDGDLVPVEPTPHDPVEAIAEAWAASGATRADPVAVFHASAPADARRLRTLLGTRAPAVQLTLAMAVHTGPGVVGAAWLRPS
jgi:DegV family protein with EDD domain